MKRFLRTILLFVLIVGVITAAVNGAYIYQQNQNSDTMSEERNDNSEIKNVPDNIQICNLGSSHGLYGFNYTDVCNDYVCFNFGQPSQMLSYDYRILKYYIDSFDKGATVFISISHFSLFGQAETSYDNFAALNKRYYKFLPDDLIKEYDAKTDFFVNYAPALATEDLISMMKTLSGKTKESLWKEKCAEEYAKEHAVKRYKVFVENKLDANGERLYNDEEIDALYAIIDLCNEHELTPVLVTTPYLSEYNKAVADNDPAFFDDYYGVIHKVVAETGVMYLDYSVDARFENNYSLFYNTDHLNIEGARQFTDIIVNQVLNLER